MSTSRKQRKALARHKAIVKARNVRNNNLRYHGCRSRAMSRFDSVFMRWAI